MITVEKVSSRSPTMRDIARRVGVSPATVSLSLRNHPSISHATRERVLQAQKDLGYSVNRFAQQFVRNTRRGSHSRKLEQFAFCLLGTTFDNVAYAPFLHGVVSESQSRHLHLSTQSLDVSADGSVTLSATIRNGSADGIIVSGIVTDATLASLREFKLPVVVLGNYHLKTNVARIETDMRTIGSTVAEDLIGRGHRDIAFVVENADHAYELDCIEGVRSYLAQHDFDPSVLKVFTTGQSYSPGSELAAPFLAQQPMPTAIVATDARVADECVSELRAHQIGVPDKVDIVALVVDANARRGVRYRRFNLGLERFGRLAVRRLAEIVETPDLEPTISVLPPLGWMEASALQPA